MIIAKVFAYYMPQATKSQKEVTNSTNKKDTTTTQIIPQKKEPEVKKDGPGFKKAQLSFAKERLPEGDKKVAGKMKRILASFNHRHIQTNRLHQKAAEWFPVIEPILAFYGIPNDFKYVPLVESGLNAGVSAKGAAGFWQFMPGTARSYGLKVNSDIDERKNLRKSTIAACKYIKELHDIFGNWALVAAAYNVGDNHMKKQINRQNQKNYFKMKLNRETAGYVYKLISMKAIVENPVQYGFRAPRALLAYNAENERSERELN